MNTPTLKGFGVRLEPISERHIASLETVATDLSIWQYMNLRIATAADVHAWVDDSMRLNATDNVQVWVTRLADGQVVGSSRLFDLQPKHRTGEIGFTWLAAPYRGSGVNPRVKLLQLTHAFETLALRRVALKTHHENLQSQRAMLKLGAHYEGTFRNHMLMPDGST
ncbi:MAG: GNAT family N-acetyltransferase, partial [Janthinobacterium lividum]